VIPPDFDYHRPADLAETVAILREHGDEAKVLSGGQSLIPMMKLRLASPEHVVDINRVKGLDTLAEEEGDLRIGALVRESELERSELVRTRYPLLWDASRVVADPLVRNRATVCGNVAHADPANDHPAAMLALDARVVAVGSEGTREISIDDFFQGLFTTALGPDEVATELRVPEPGPGSGGAYLKLERKVGDYATAAVAAQLHLSEEGDCVGAGIGLTNAGFTPLRVGEAEELLVGEEPRDDLIAEAARIAARAAQPTGDRRGSVAYKRDLIRVLTERALRIARERADGAPPRGGARPSGGHGPGAGPGSPDPGGA